MKKGTRNNLKSMESGLRESLIIPVLLTVLLIIMSMSLSSTVHAEAKDAEAKDTATESPKWQGTHGAFFIGISPLFLPKVGSADRLNTGNITSFDIGVETKETILFGLRYAHATIPSLQVYNPLTFITSNYLNASLIIIEPFLGFNLPLNRPHTTFGPIQLYIPVNVGLAVVSISAPSDTDTYKGLSLDTSLGLGARLYTKSIFRADLSVLYHFGFPIEKITSDTSPTNNVQSPTGETMKSSLTGFEVRLGISLLFPDSPKPEDSQENQK